MKKGNATIAQSFDRKISDLERKIKVLKEAKAIFEEENNGSKLPEKVPAIVNTKQPKGMKNESLGSISIEILKDTSGLHLKEIKQKLMGRGREASDPVLAGSLGRLVKKNVLNRPKPGFYVLAD